MIYSRDETGEHPQTVVTAWHGPLRGRRVVAGRERECVSVVEKTAA